MAKNEKTPPEIAKIASKLLKNPKTPKEVKAVTCQFFSTSFFKYNNFSYI